MDVKWAASVVLRVALLGVCLVLLAVGARNWLIERQHQRIERKALEAGDQLWRAIIMRSPEEGYPNTLEPLIESGELQMPPNPYTQQPMQVVRLDAPSAGNISCLGRRRVTEYADGSVSDFIVDFILHLYGHRPSSETFNWLGFGAEYPILNFYDSAFGSKEGHPPIKHYWLEPWSEALRRHGYEDLADNAERFEEQLRRKQEASGSTGQQKEWRPDSDPGK